MVTEETKRFHFVTLLAILFLFQNAPSSALHVEIVPQPVNELINDHVTITCLANDSPYWSGKVMVMSMGRLGQHPLVTLSSGAPIQYGVDAKANMKAEGTIVQNASNSFVRLIIQSPGSRDAGAYSCSMYYLDGYGQLKQGTASANLTVDNKDDKAVLRHLLRKVDDLAKVMEQKSVKIKDLERKVDQEQDLISDVNLELRKQQNQTEKLETYDSNLMKIFAGLKDVVTQQTNKIHDQDSTITDLKKQLKTELDHSKEQDTKEASLLQKVSDMQKSATQQSRTIQDQENKLKRQEQQTATQGKQLEEQNNVLKELLAKDADGKTAFNKLVAKVSTLEKTVTQKGNEIKEQGGKVQHQEKVNSDQAKQLKGLQDRLTELGTKEAKNEETVNGLVIKVSRVEKGAGQVNSKLKDHTGTITNQGNLIADQGRQIHDLQELTKQVKTQSDNLKQQVAGFHKPKPICSFLEKLKNPSCRS